MFSVLEEQKGDLCGWSRMYEERSRFKEVMGDNIMERFVSNYKNFGFYFE